MIAGFVGGLARARGLRTALTEILVIKKISESPPRWRGGNLKHLTAIYYTLYVFLNMCKLL